MSFILQDGAEEGEADVRKISWMRTDRSLSTPIPVTEEESDTAYREEPLAAREDAKLRRRVILLWVIEAILIGTSVALACFCVALTHKGQLGGSWILTLPGANFAGLAFGVALGISGLFNLKPVRLRHGATIHVVVCVVALVDCLCQLTYVLLVSKKKAIWQKGGIFTAEQIWEYNRWLVALTLLNLALIPVCFYASRSMLKFAERLELDERSQARGGDCRFGSQYGTFKPSAREPSTSVGF